MPQGQHLPVSTGQMFSLVSLFSTPLQPPSLVALCHIYRIAAGRQVPLAFSPTINSSVDEIFSFVDMPHAFMVQKYAELWALNPTELACMYWTGIELSRTGKNTWMQFIIQI